MACEAGIIRQLAAVAGHVLADVDLRKLVGSRRESAVAELAQFTAAADRHLGQHLTLFEVDVGGDWAVAQLTLHRSVSPGRVLGVLLVVTHRAAFVTDFRQKPIRHGGSR